LNTAATAGGNTSARAGGSCWAAGAVDSAAFAGLAAFLLAALPPPGRGLSLGARGRGTPEPVLRGELAAVASALALPDSGLPAPVAARAGGVPRGPGGSEAGLDEPEPALSAALLEEGGGSERMRRLLSQTGVKKPDR
jgi:hypothetical protein